MRFLALVFILISCKEPPKPLPPPPPKFIEHTVKYQGETVASLAAWYLGDLKRWKEIVDVNPGLKPEKIKIGDIILIPTESIVKTDPFPKPKAAAKKPTDKIAPVDKPDTGKVVKEEEATKAEEKVPEPIKEQPEPPTVTDSEREKLREKTRLELLEDVLNQTP